MQLTNPATCPSRTHSNFGSIGAIHGSRVKAVALRPGVVATFPSVIVTTEVKSDEMHSEVLLGDSVNFRVLWPRGC